ncbi:MAG TPA: type II secretion system protein [Candidatus Saccharimonadia bacterium]|nr:type II secretion system protein [Candidatus Saccharimonadia bacterium]
MKRSQRLSSAAGFTIIETLIVLAIAGMILLIVFLAIPALTRNSRNNQRRQDVSAILQAVSHYELNNSGSFPNPCGGMSQAACNANQNQPLYFTHNLTFYDLGTAGSVVMTPEDPLASVSNPNNLDQVAIFNHQLCLTDGSGESTGQSAGYNDIVALYAIETGAGQAKLCQQL